MRDGFRNIVNQLPISSNEKQKILDDICTKPTRRDLIKGELSRMRYVFILESVKSQSDFDKKTINELINQLENAEILIMVAYENINCDACDQRRSLYFERIEHVDYDPYLEEEFTDAMLNCSDCAVTARREWGVIVNDILY